MRGGGFALLVGLTLAALLSAGSPSGAQTESCWPPLENGGLGGADKTFDFVGGRVGKFFECSPQGLLRSICFLRQWNTTGFFTYTLRLRAEPTSAIDLYSGTGSAGHLSQANVPGWECKVVDLEWPLSTMFIDLELPNGLHVGYDDGTPADSWHHEDATWLPWPYRPAVRAEFSLCPNPLRNGGAGTTAPALLSPESDTAKSFDCARRSTISRICALGVGPEGSTVDFALAAAPGQAWLYSGTIAYSGVEERWHCREMDLVWPHKTLFVQRFGGTALVSYDTNGTSDGWRYDFQKAGWVPTDRRWAYRVDYVVPEKPEPFSVDFRFTPAQSSSPIGQLARVSLALENLPANRTYTIGSPAGAILATGTTTPNGTAMTAAFDVPSTFRLVVTLGSGETYTIPVYARVPAAPEFTPPRFMPYAPPPPPPDPCSDCKHPDPDACADVGRFKICRPTPGLIESGSESTSAEGEAVTERAPSDSTTVAYSDEGRVRLKTIPFNERADGYGWGHWHGFAEFWRVVEQDGNARYYMTIARWVGVGGSHPSSEEPVHYDTWVWHCGNGGGRTFIYDQAPTNEPQYEVEQTVGFEVGSDGSASVGYSYSWTQVLPGRYNFWKSHRTWSDGGETACYASKLYRTAWGVGFRGQLEWAVAARLSGNADGFAGVDVWHSSKPSLYDPHWYYDGESGWLMFRVDWPL